MRDNGGRRTGIERRRFSYTGYVPDRRIRGERRNGEDRRSGRERRSGLDRRALFSP